MRRLTCKKETKKLILFRNVSNEPIYIGWKIFVIGVFHVSFGGGIVSQHGIIKKRKKFMSAKKPRLIEKTGNRIKMCSIHGFHLHYGHFLQWAGRMKTRQTLNVISRQMH